MSSFPHGWLLLETKQFGDQAYKYLILALKVLAMLSFCISPRPTNIMHKGLKPILLFEALGPFTHIPCISP